MAYDTLASNGDNQTADNQTGDGLQAWDGLQTDESLTNLAGIQGVESSDQANDEAIQTDKMTGIAVLDVGTRLCEKSDDPTLRVTGHFRQNQVRELRRSFRLLSTKST